MYNVTRERFRLIIKYDDVNFIPIVVVIRNAIMKILSIWKIEKMYFLVLGLQPCNKFCECGVIDVRKFLADNAVGAKIIVSLSYNFLRVNGNAIM